MSIRFGKSPARYYTYDGKQLPSVTSILTLLSKGALIPWAANCAMDKVASYVSTQSTHIFLHQWQDVFDQARTAYKQASIEAADYGTYIHTLCEYYFKGYEIESPHEQTQKLMTSFYAWCKKHNVKPIETEVVVYGDGYAGRVDLICEIDQFWYKSKDKADQKLGRRKRVIVLIDFKTGKGSYYAEWPLQTSAYRRAWDKSIACEHFDGCGKFRDSTCKKHCFDIIQYHGVLKFNKETCRVNYKDMTPTYERDLDAFMLLVKFWELVNES